jgi:glyoxylase-like metal-dependent hydrolase (beta-lactamase superfamily II)
MLHIEKFTFSPFQENTYVVANDQKDCFIIDPGCYTPAEEEELAKYILQNELNPRALLNTHCHIDHVFGNKFVAEKYGLTPKIPKGEAEMLQAVSQVAKMYGLDYKPSPEPDFLEGKTVLLGQEVFQILEAPGHSPAHVGFYHKAGKQLFSGDVLFRNSIGRHDLPGGDLNTLLESIRKVLFALPDDVTVYPGHMENTTIGYEKEHNPFLN